MKKIMFALLSTLSFLSVANAENVRGYIRQDGTYVQSYNRSNRNNTVQDNYSHVGNFNPYTGQSGSAYDRNNSSSEYGQSSPSHYPGSSASNNPFDR